MSEKKIHLIEIVVWFCVLAELKSTFVHQPLTALTLAALVAVSFWLLTDGSWTEQGLRLAGRRVRRGAKRANAAITAKRFAPAEPAAAPAEAVRKGHVSAGRTRCSRSHSRTPGTI